MTDSNSCAESVPKWSRTYLTQKQLADFLSISERSLERQRSEGAGPRFHKAGRRVLYRWDDVEEWLAGRSFASTAAAKEAGIR
jgi:Helix-turn-helix domain